VDVIEVTSAGPVAPPLVLVLAAGAGTRMGGPKLFARVRGSTFSSHIARALHTVGWPSLWVLRSENQLAPLKELLNILPDVCINSDPDGDMLSSIQAALLTPTTHLYQLFCIWPVDFPLIRPETLQKLMIELGSCEGILPHNNNCTGIPFIVRRHTLCRWLSTLPHHGLRQAMVDHPVCICKMPIQDPGPFLNLNTPEDCRSAEDPPD
jgi:CTP:molybdopterin cytidylyltransferase MocA